MDSKIRSCFVNAGFGKWYPKGSERLKRSMIYFGCAHDMIFTSEPFEGMDTTKPYRIKYHAIKEAIEKGYTHIIWLDCSLWFTDSPNILMEKLAHDGGLFVYSGFNLAQTSADSDLSWANKKRDEAEELSEIWSCVFGFNLETEQGQKFWEKIESSFKNGVFDTSRHHNNNSQDERFLYARQDQTAVSWAYYLSGYDCAVDPNGIVTDFNNNKQSLIYRQGL